MVVNVHKLWKDINTLVSDQQHHFNHSEINEGI